MIFSKPASNRLVFLLFILTLAASVFWVSAQRGETGIRDLWRPSAATDAKKTEPISVQGPVLDLQDSFARVAAQIKPAVVSITATHVETVQVVPEQFYFGDPFEEFFREFHGQPDRRRSAPQPRQYQRRQQGMGSGVVVDPRGYILTNEHVVRGADELTVTFQSPEEKKFTGKVVGSDPRSDLAVIQIKPTSPLAYGVLGDSEKVRVGDWAIAVGSPFGLEQTVTVGVISAMRQSLNIEGMSYSGLLQTDAAINRGNSGGPLVNIHGEIVGINTAIYAPTGVFAGIGFAIPANRIKDIMEQLIEKGHVVRGWMGVEILPVDEVLAKQFDLPKAEGVMINSVQPGSPAEKAGLTRGDVIVRFDGQPTPSPEVLRERVGQTPPKKTVGLDVFRDGKKITLSLTTAEMPAEPASDQARPSGQKSDKSILDWEGARLTPLTPELGGSGVCLLEQWVLR
ncbi:MAG: trypsin-like peptidase domain-containing protein [Elusimicrobia bacterium]|nr:trypsin-like peptidase domain-containing protein [Elusimicrobiota bacterium]